MAQVAPVVRGAPVVPVMAVGVPEAAEQAVAALEGEVLEAAEQAVAALEGEVLEAAEQAVVALEAAVVPEVEVAAVLEAVEPVVVDPKSQRRFWQLLRMAMVAVTETAVVMVTGVVTATA